jgi:ribonucleoside-diphosphate reductase alpha subunit
MSTPADKTEPWRSKASKTVLEGSRTIAETVKVRARDLKEVDLSLIDRDVVAASAVQPITAALENLARVASDKSCIDPEWGLLAGRLLMEDIHRNVSKRFSEATFRMKQVLHPEYYEFVMKHAEYLDSIVDHSRDFTFDYFAVATLLKSYLCHLSVHNEGRVLMETPQYMYLRVAVYLHYPDLKEIARVYTNLKYGNYSHATPTLFNAGMKRPALSSCFLQHIQDDTVQIAEAVKHQMIISKNAGGLGIDWSSIRHSEIGSQGLSDGIVPWIKITDRVLKAVTQGGRRKGSGAMYLRDLHIDIFEFIELQDDGPEEIRTRDLFLAIMVSDLFMQRVEEDGVWSLFCPNKVPGLFDQWGLDFEMQYKMAEKEGLYLRQVRARDLWVHILNMQIKRGMPFILYMDACNRKNNQKHSGVIRCSNLCCEIIQVTDKDQIASCNLASVCLNKCIDYDDNEKPYFSFELLSSYTRELVRNLNNAIDRNHYPDEIPQIKYSNMLHRPLGIGVQGLADTFAILDIAWVDETKELVSKEAKDLNHKIFECMYYSAIRESIEQAKVHGPYEAFKNSPASKGLFQFDMWSGERVSRELHAKSILDISPCQTSKHILYSDAQWEGLRQEMITHGLRNSLLLALMPTASSAHILGNVEAFEPISNAIYARTVLAGQFMIVNKHVVRDLKEIGMWHTDTVRKIFVDSGSIQTLVAPDNTPREIVDRLEKVKRKYLSVYELPQKILIDLAMERGEYICQTQSFNYFVDKPNKTKLTAYHFYCWKKGAKTGMYYLRQKVPPVEINMSINSIVIPEKREDNKGECLLCQA